MPKTFIQHAFSPRIKERSTFGVIAYFRTGGGSGATASTPTTVHYRIDDLTTKTEIRGWTSVTPDTSVIIETTSRENRIISDAHTYERRQITVASDKGEDNESRDTYTWIIENIGGFDEAEA